MNEEILLSIVVLIIFIVGFFLLRAAIKDTLKYSNARRLQAIIRGVFGFEGERVIYGLFGILIMMGSAYFLFLFYGNNMIGGKSKKKQEYVRLELIKDHPHYTLGGSTLSKISNLKRAYKHDKEQLNSYSSIDLSNHELDEIPLFVWEMKNLKTINLQENELKKLPALELKNLPKLSKIVLSGNPLDTTNFQQIRQSNPSLQILFNHVNNN